MISLAHPLQAVWNVAMLLGFGVVLFDLARGDHWTSRRERIWTGVFVLLPGGWISGFTIPAGVMAWVAWYRWRESGGWHPRGRSAEVEDGPHDLARLHGGDGVVDAVEGPHV